MTAGKNEVTLEFHQSEEAAQCLVEMRFHIPAGITQADSEEDRAKVSGQKITLSHAQLYRVFVVSSPSKRVLNQEN